MLNTLKFGEIDTNKNPNDNDASIPQNTAQSNPIHETEAQTIAPSPPKFA